MSTTAWAGPDRTGPGHKPARLLVGVLSADTQATARVVKRLACRLGPLVSLGPPQAFDQTSYYQAEMGPHLFRRLACFQDLVDAWRLPVYKRICQSLERDFCVDRRRLVNLDPGLISAGSLVLATSKPAPHRVRLSPHCFAEVTLIYQNGRFEPLPWTYPDYAQRKMRKQLELLRRRYLWDLKARRGTGFGQSAKGRNNCPSP